MKAFRLAKEKPGRYRADDLSGNGAALAGGVRSDEQRTDADARLRDRGEIGKRRVKIRGLSAERTEAFLQECLQ